MNYLAHGRHFVDQPYFLAGTAVPDWLSVVDRRVRARQKLAAPLVDSDNSIEAAVAAGIVQHHVDDAWFHATGAFAELEWQFTLVIRDELGADSGLRPRFLGHILVELLLDAALMEDRPALLTAYYAAMDRIDESRVQEIVEKIAGKPAGQLAWFIGRFKEVRFLEDYTDDEKLLYRLNQVMQRVKLAPLPTTFAAMLPEFRKTVRARQDQLLTPDRPSSGRDTR